MYLAKILLDAGQREVQWLLKDCYELHRSLMKMYPDEGGGVREKYNILYNMEINDRTTVIYLQSDLRPEIEKLKYKSIVQGPKNISRFVQSIIGNQEFRFRLKACPSKKVTPPADSKSTLSKRVFLPKAEEQVEWLQRKGIQHGFSLLEGAGLGGFSLEIRPIPPGLGRKKGITFSQVVYDGLLKVEDQSLFQQAVATGIGPEKAFGCGMMMLKGWR